MAVIAHNKFLGEIPNMDAHLLPADYAQEAVDCEFAGGSLRPVKGGFLLRSMATNPVKGIYTENGIHFYTWQQETFAFRSPVIDDTYGRMYFLTPPGDFTVALTSGMNLDGYSPSDAIKWKAGVPRPTVAPGLQTIDRTTLRDYPAATVAIEAWWEYAGKQYGSTTTATQTSAFRTYIFTPPAVTPDMPSGMTLVCRVRIVSGASDILSILVREGSPGRSNALPGGVEASISNAGAQKQVTLTWGVAETRAYTYTYVNLWSEEGATAPPATISVNYMQDVRVAVTPGNFTGYRPFSGYRVYRTYGTGATYIQTDVTGSTTDLLDSTGSARAVGKALESSSWTPPPSGMQGVDLSPNGWFVGFKGNMLYMSEPYRPHAWPYSMTFGAAIRGVKVGQQSVVVTTADGVYIVTGAFPSSAQQIRINLPQAGISSGSMAVVDGAVVYASNDGLVFVNGSDASMALSQKLFTRVKWQEFMGSALRDKSLKLGYHDGCLVLTSKSRDQGYSIRFDEAVGMASQLSTGYDAMFFLPVADSLYYSSGSAVYQFKGAGPVSMSWHGRDWVYRENVTFGAAYIRCSGAVTVTIYANGEQAFASTVTSGYFRLPDMGKHLRWSVKLSGTAEVFEFAMAQTMGELKSV